MSRATMLLTGIFLVVLLLPAGSMPTLAASDSPVVGSQLQSKNAYPIPEIADNVFQLGTSKLSYAPAKDPKPLFQIGLLEKNNPLKGTDSRKIISSPKRQVDQSPCEGFHFSSPPTLPTAKKGNRYRYQLKTTGNQPAIRFSLLEGRLPAGLRLDAKGHIAGIPQKPGSYRFTIRAVLNCPTNLYKIEKRFTLRTDDPAVALSIKTQPASVDLEPEKDTALQIRYIFYLKSADQLSLYSPKGIFLARKRIIGEIKRPLKTSLKGKTGRISEALAISDSVVQKARHHGAAEISYIRNFAVPGTPVTQQTEVIIRIRPTQKLQIQELRLHFENNKTSVTIGKDQSLPKITAKIKSTGSGLLKGYWEVDGKRATGVFQYKTTGGGITLAYPQKTSPLSNLLPGIHRIRFVIREPRTKLTLPQVMLVVALPQAIPPESPDPLQNILASSYLSGQIVVITESSESGRYTIEYLRTKYGLRILETFTLNSLNQNGTIFHTENDISDLIENIEEENGVLLVQPNHIFRTLTEPLSDMQHIYSTLRLSEVHRRYKGQGVTLAIIDTGVDIRHTDLKKRIAGHANFLRQSPYRGEIHGTALAGVMVASINDYGIAGIAPEAGLVALRACKQISEKNPEGRCYTSSVSKALDMAIEEKADIVNMSFGAFIPDPLMIQILNEGDKRGILFVAPVGNRKNSTKPSFPASHSNVLAVGGIDAAGKGYPNEELASAARVCAPALNVLTTIPGNRHNFLSGTSISAAIVSGLLAIAKEKHRRIGIRQLPTYKGDICRWQEDLLIR
jgi:hypothetical protein